MKARLHFLFLILLPVYVFSQNNHCDITDSEAKLHFGEEVAVCGKIVQLYKPKYTKGNPIFLTFGRHYPDHTLTAVIWGDIFTKEFSEALVKYYFSKNVLVFGTIKEYQGKPVITIKNKSQIEVLINFEEDAVKITPK